MTTEDWERRLPQGVHLESRDAQGFRFGIALDVGDDGLWPMRCPIHPDDHLFKIKVTTNHDDDRDLASDADDPPTFCPYCGHAADLWDFAPEQNARITEAAEAVVEQYVSSIFNNMFRDAFGGRSSSSGGMVRVSTSYTPSPPPPRRQLPKQSEIEETRRTMQCQQCGEVVAVYGLAIYCPNCGQLAPVQQFQELIRLQRHGLAALADLPEQTKRGLIENGMLGATFENTVKDGFSALETYLKRRFELAVPDVELRARGSIFQRLDDTAELYRTHIGLDLPARLGAEGWERLKQAAAMRHVLVHNAGIVDARLLERLPEWPQQLGQRIQVSKSEADEFVDLLEELAIIVA